MDLQEENKLLRRIALELNSKTDQKELLDSILEYSNKLVPFSSVNVCLVKNFEVEVVRLKGYEKFNLTAADLEKLYRSSRIPDMEELKSEPKPVLVPNVAEEPLWETYETSGWVRSYLGMPMLSEGEVIGLISFDSDKPDSFSEADIRTLEPFVSAAAVALEKSNLIKNLRNVIEEKTFLMEELNHRVKNNLSLITSLINLCDTGPECEKTLEGLRNRIMAIQIVHEKLYQNNQVTSISFHDYVHDLLHLFFSSFVEKNVTLELAIDRFLLPTKTVVSLGLIINELATNTIKYGIKNGEDVRFSVQLIGADKTLVLRISNTGTPLPKSFNAENPETFGMKLVSILVDQIKGTLEVTREPSPVFTITFPV